MVKVLLFFVLIFGIMFYPLITDNYKTIKPNGSGTELPDVEVKDGKFFIYNGILEKKGDFKILNIYKKDYIAFKLNVYDLLKFEIYKSSKTVFKGDIITGYNVRYKNKDMELNTKIAHYDKNTKIINGGKFELYSKDFRGYGENFEVDNKKDLYAQKITYYLKVEK